MSQQVNPGWFPDPVDDAKERYFDGLQWTIQVRDASAPERRPPRKPGLVWAGLAVLFLGLGTMTWLLIGRPAPEAAAPVSATSTQEPPATQPAATPSASASPSQVVVYTEAELLLIQGLGLGSDADSVAAAIAEVNQWCAKAEEASAVSLVTEFAGSDSQLREQLSWVYLNYCPNPAAVDLLVAVNTPGAWVDGQWSVATREGMIPPRGYRTATAVEDCSWIRYNAAQEEVEQVTSFSGDYAEINLLPTDEVVVTSGCGVWLPNS